jgi:hypothetical protein
LDQLAEHERAVAHPPTNPTGKTPTLKLPRTCAKGVVAMLF